MKLSIFLGDIADAPADAICTSTNPRLSLMMGTGASVRGRGGPAVLQACEAMLAERGSTLPAGSVHATTAGALPHKIAIHCIASDNTHHSSEAIIRACVTNALATAGANGCTTIAMPIFGTGHARIRFADAVRAMVQEAFGAKTRVREVKLVTNDEDRVDDMRAVLKELVRARIDLERSPNFDAETNSLWSDDYSLLG